MTTVLDSTDLDCELLRAGTECYSSLHGFRVVHSGAHWHLLNDRMNKVGAVSKIALLGSHTSTHR